MRRALARFAMTADILLRSVGRKIQEERKARGLTQADLGRRLGIALGVDVRSLDQPAEPTTQGK